MSNPLRFVDLTGLWNEESRWYKPWTWLNVPDSKENILGQLALDVQWQVINSEDPSQYIASFQEASGIEVTGIADNGTTELLGSYGQWYLMNNNMSLSDYMMARWRQTEEHIFWRLTNSEYQRLKSIDDLYTVYAIYSLASLGIEFYQEYISVTRIIANQNVMSSSLKWVDNKGNVIWPPNDGAVTGTEKNIFLGEGYRFDRFGSNYGRFVSPVGTPYSMMSLAPGTEIQPYRVFEVVKPIRAQGAITSGWFGEPGGGSQFKLESSVDNLLQLKRIIEVVK